MEGGLRARGRFLAREWREAQTDAQERLGLYPRGVDTVVARLRGTGVDGPAARDRYAALVAGRADAEIAETFYNSVMRRVLEVVGVDPAAEFTATPFSTCTATCSASASGATCRSARRPARSPTSSPTRRPAG